MKSLLILLAVACTTTAVYTHPGKTDAKGGHVDSKTGKYHLHKKPDTPAKKDVPKKKK